jgi:exosortase C (VPDSG-CTERM-specific)
MKNAAHGTGNKSKRIARGSHQPPTTGMFIEWRSLARTERTRLIGGFAFAALLALIFFQPLLSLVRYAARTELHSHILLVPFISTYLIYLRRPDLPGKYRSSPACAIIPGVTGLVAGAGWWCLRESVLLSRNDLLALMALSFVLLVVAGGFLFLGREWMTAAVFPVAFLFFMVPLPDGAANWLETVSKLASADAADVFFSMTGTPVLRDGTVFRLPGIAIEVAQECSGIRSSLVLLLTSLIASYMFLQNPWRRIILVALVIPLGILRNGFRILVIGLLCVHIGPRMIDSAIHHHGGPFFFALSLIPLFLLLLWLRKGDTGRDAKVGRDQAA